MRRRTPRAPRHLVIGAPILVALSPTKLDAVLAHEFGHFAHRDTRLLPVVMRGRSGLAGALDAASGFAGNETGGKWVLRGQPMIYAMVHAYAVRFLAATHQISRTQGYAADRISAELCGRDTAADVVAEMPAYDAAFRHFWRRFARCGCRPRSRTAARGRVHGLRLHARGARLAGSRGVGTPHADVAEAFHVRLASTHR